MNHLDLFSGIGGFALGLQRTGFTTVAFCEIESYCQRVLAKHWPDIPIYEDIHHVTADRLAADGLVDIDIITGGYPCQPFSTAGQRGGEEDDRHLWPQIARLVRELVAAGRQPAWLCFENVAGHISLGLDTVLANLDALGYRAWPLVIPAAAVGAYHRRDRLWILAHAKHDGQPAGGDQRQLQGEPDRAAQEEQQHAGCVQAVAHPELTRAGNQDRTTGQQGWHTLDTGAEGIRQANGQVGTDRQWSNRRWPTEPGMGRVADGIPNRVDRLRGLGNAVVPQIPEIIGRAILEASK